ncbi:sigma-54-dependent Fis family transcriptional regulator [Pseudomonas sp. gcc21]|uniref:sigma-54-dependent transcriptional regulator n=1 Tax=Pseudomonas sp. gcc21 TaxID=2726989 RepID=UPI001451FD94|nr:sigma-54 dependent transcriptional regulator [Pseudomonas sp. gcc21]QJD58838.1 sigma-54-dependent Fis family transcriptional regulator [Pseudomonas sp. gcc21]
MTTRILLVEDDRSLREALADTLSLGGYDYFEAESAEAALKLLEREAVSMVVSDVNMPGMDGHDLLRILNQQYPQLPVLLMTAYGTVQQAVTAMRDGAVDYLVKPFEPRALLDLIAQHSQGRLQPLNENGPVAVEPASQQLLQLAARVAASDSTVLISGESGTGKEVLARYIHQHSPRADQPFIAINCAAIPENMLEATLFGHEKGSFTGAIAAAPGKFEQANGGTLLLDEISEMPLALQAKLLRVLQEREVERVGGRKLIKLDIRVIATTNRDMLAEVAAGRFREDLYYRLGVFPLQWSPLRNRPGDILPIAERLLNKHMRKMNQTRVQFAEDARQALRQHPWPGNVRELDNAVQRAMILQQGGVIRSQDLCLGMVPGAAISSQATVQPQVLPASSVAAAPPVAGDLESGVKGHEYQMILDVLRAERGRRKEAAERLGISPRTLRYKLARMREAGFIVEGGGV